MLSFSHQNSNRVLKGTGKGENVEKLGCWDTTAGNAKFPWCWRKGIMCTGEERRGRERDGLLIKIPYIF